MARARRRRWGEPPAKPPKALLPSSESLTQKQACLLSEQQADSHQRSPRSITCIWKEERASKPERDAFKFDLERNVFANGAMLEKRGKDPPSGPQTRLTLLLPGDSSRLARGVVGGRAKMSTDPR